MEKAKKAGEKQEKQDKIESPTVKGFTVGAAAAGMRKDNALDVCVIVSDPPCAAAGVFTRNRVCGEPVKLDRLHLRHPSHRAIVANAKISNVCTGIEGLRDAREMAARLAARIGCQVAEVLVASTGIIGRRLPMERILPGIDNALAARSAKGWPQGAQAIMTTDTRLKMAGRRVKLGGKTVSIAGMAKGSGMIHPNMATMLCFVATDAAIDKALLQAILHRVVDRSFNCVTVDGDTSTSDTMLVLANGAAGNRRVSQDGPQARVFESALESLSVELARKIARDGEGAQHLVTIQVRGTRSDAAARKIAQTVATSPLVKTAIYGRDANWGRITAAAGRAGVPFAVRNLSLRMNGFLVFESGRPVPFDESALTQTLHREEISIDIVVGTAQGGATVWTCDLTDAYIRINADYRT
jgi:glutamate N-acetyltransferase/amino-acid N-acetyltransferase